MIILRNPDAVLRIHFWKSPYLESSVNQIVKFCEPMRDVSTSFDHNWLSLIHYTFQFEPNSLVSTFQELIIANLSHAKLWTMQNSISLLLNIWHFVEQPFFQKSLCSKTIIKNYRHTIDKSETEFIKICLGANIEKMILEMRTLFFKYKCIVNVLTVKEVS